MKGPLKEKQGVQVKENKQGEKETKAAVGEKRRAAG